MQDTTCFSSGEFQFLARTGASLHAEDTTCFSSVEFQFLATELRFTVSSGKLKLHAAKAGGI